ncbi:hypothetical protein DSL72_003379 [Monilinia vaccinii-corymbosi]|uniref:Uncharacterized protein n=1 Tax=Monilinia vaccinii-corymbosi TaxID=61207 RepID=A0A8A3NZJ7_9HELO|nr:hypothetical protein DSL72_003379 [Monilinia vaccinii-corymbosi]
MLFEDDLSRLIACAVILSVGFQQLNVTAVMAIPIRTGKSDTLSPPHRGTEARKHQSKLLNPEPGENDTHQTEDFEPNTKTFFFAFFLHKTCPIGRVSRKLPPITNHDFDTTRVPRWFQPRQFFDFQIVVMWQFSWPPKSRVEKPDWEKGEEGQVDIIVTWGYTFDLCYYIDSAYSPLALALACRPSQQRNRLSGNFK